MCALLVRPALNQAIAIIQKYQKQAISDVNAKLAPIAEFHKGPKQRTAFPWLTIAYEGTVFRESSEQTRMQQLMLMLTIEAGNFDSELAQDAAIDYLRVLDHIFNDLSGPTFVDWETKLTIVHETVPSGQTTPWKQGTVKEVFVESEDQSLVYRNEVETPIIQASMRMRFDLEEN